MFTSISTAVIRKESQDKEVVRKKWQIEILVTCVLRHLLVIVAFTIISRPTVEARDTTVHSAINHSAKMVI